MGKLNDVKLTVRLNTGAMCRLWLFAAYNLFPATFDDAQGWIDRIKWVFSQLGRVGLNLGKRPGQEDDDAGGEGKEDKGEESHTPHGEDEEQGSTPHGHHDKRKQGSR